MQPSSINDLLYMLLQQQHPSIVMEVDNMQDSRLLPSSSSSSSPTPDISQVIQLQQATLQEVSQLKSLINDLHLKLDQFE